jgi:hypothetical protein
MRKLLSFAILSISLISLTGCPAKKSAIAPGEDRVLEKGLEGEPRNFSGNYGGTCQLETEGRIYNNCTVSLVIRQTNRKFKITTTFSLVNPRSNRNAAIKNTVRETLRIDNKVLLSSTGEVGIIGQSAARYQTADSQMTLVNERLTKMRLDGYYFTPEGVRVNVRGLLGRY